MAGRRYHDLVILTDDAELQDDQLAAFTVRVLESPAGEGEVKERVEVRTDYLSRKRNQLARRRLRPNEQIELGRYLSNLLLPPYARNMLWSSLSALGPGEGLRLRLRLLNPLSDLPWEYLHLQMAANRPRSDAFLALDPRISIVRHRAMAIPPQWSPPGDTRRILIAMASPRPHDKYPLLEDLPLEQRQIKEALAKVEGVEVQCLPDYGGLAEGQTIPGARLEDVQAGIRDLDQVDVFHFSGHGDFEEFAEMTAELGKWRGTGYIILADEYNTAVRIPGKDLTGFLGERGIRLVTLCACETATTGTGDAWSSVATAMLEDRIPCVVAMQFTVYSALAAAFIGAVYETLVDGRTIDEAVSQGRAAMLSQSYDTLAGARDWGTPVLYSRVDGAHILPPVTDENARRLARQSIEIRSDLHQAWWEWMANGATASKSQLRTLSEAEGLELRPMQALLLLRSALVEDEPVEPWLARLREQGIELVTDLDTPAGDSVPAGVSMPAEGGDVLGLDNVPSGCPQGVGAVAWAAASHPDVTARQTAALALTALPAVPDEGLTRLDRALRGVAPGWKRYARKAELLGTLADGDPQIARHTAGNLPPWDRGGIWFWRFRRRARRQSDWIRALVLGAAVGAGVALGAQRGLLALPAGPLAMARFGINFFWGGLLGATVGLAAGLAEPVLVGRRQAKGAGEPSSRRANLLALLLGTLLFGLMHLMVGWFNGLNLGERALMLVGGTLTGFGVNLALYGQPRAGWRLGIGGWLLRLAAAALPALLAVYLVIAAGAKWAATAITRTGAHLSDNFGEDKYVAIFRLIDANQNAFSYLDAALAGILLTAGIAIGWQVAAKRFLRPRVSDEKPGD